MKKIRALSLALSLVLVPVGNQLYAAESGWTPRPVAQTPAQNFNLPTDDPEVSLASDIFEDMVMSRMDFGNTENLTRKFRVFANFVSNMRENSKKYFSAIILSCPVISGVDESIPSDIRVRMIGSLLKGVYTNVSSVEWNIDVNNHRGTLSLNMRDIPSDIRLILSLYSDFIHVQGNKISYSF